MKKSIFLPFLCCLAAIFPSYLNAESITVQDTIRTDRHWTSDTVKVTGNLWILDDVTLSIDPGTRVEFQGHYYMYMQGTILALGTGAEPVVFTINDSTGYHDFSNTDGGWNGILFYNAIGSGGPDGAMIDNDTSRFDHCIIEYTKSVSSPLVWSAIEVGVFSRLVISNCEIRYNYSDENGGGLRVFSESDIIIRDNYIHHNISAKNGGGIFVTMANPVITGNTISYNRTLSKDPLQGKGGGIHIGGNNPVVRNNIISHNSAIYGPGIFMSNAFSLVESNTITYNTGYDDPPNVRSIGGGIYMEATASPLIRSNLIANNKIDEGGGIYSYNSKPDIVNNLIVNNVGDSAGGAFYGWDSEVLLLNNTMAHNLSLNGAAMELTNTETTSINNIFWDNGNNQIHLQDTYAELYILNSVIRGGVTNIGGVGTYQAAGIINQDPGFISPSAGEGPDYDGLAGDWSITAGSPCVNAGATGFKASRLPEKDLAGNDRIKHSIIDIGAYEVNVPSISASDTIKTNTTWIADTVKITGNVVINDDVILTILPGTVVEFQDTFRLKVNGTLIADGLPGQVIVFTAADTAGFSMPGTAEGGWQGIVFDNSYEGMNNAMKDNEPSVFNFCRFSYVKQSGSNYEGGVILSMYYDGIEIRHCDFIQNHAYYGGAGIHLYKSDLSVEDCLFRNNLTEDGGTAIFATEAGIELLNCLFKDNEAMGPGGAVWLNFAEATVEGCRFTGNTAGYRGGAINANQSELIIQNSLFANNLAGNSGGALYAEYESLQLVNNILVNNTSSGAGGGAYLRYEENLVTLNNTIAFNRANKGGGIYNSFSNHISVNDILYGNEADVAGNQYMTHSVTTALDFRNGLYEGGTGAIEFAIGQELTGSYTDLIDTLPYFAKPSEGAGTDFDASNSDWRLLPVSPCINTGTATGTVIDLPATDISGDPRDFGGGVDMGACENQYGLPVITRQPKNQILCQGDTAVFRTRTEIISNFQWQKDGQDIAGAAGENLVITSITSDDDGNYQCIVSNSFGTVPGSSAYLAARAAPEFIRQPVDIWAVEGDRTIISSSGIGTPPMDFQWFKDGNPIPGKTFPDLWINDTDQGDEGLYHCEAVNACGTVSSDTVQLYIAPQICMVTVDTGSNKNLVVWEKRSSAPIASYNVYRESIVAGEYEVIGNVPADALSVFTDETAKPASQAYIYKITALTADGLESDIDLCKPHKTIHLLSSRNTETGRIQLDWDPYYGFDYGTYYIFRSKNGSPLDNYYPISSSLNTWQDDDGTPDDTIYYRVAVERAEMCYPSEGKKAGTGPYRHALSNLDDNKKKAMSTDRVAAGALKIYPNPLIGSATVEFPDNGSSEYRYLIRDLSGRLFRTGLVSGNRLVIERGELPPGMYSIELIGSKVCRGRFIVR